MGASVVGGDGESDLPSRTVDEYELVKFVVHTSRARSNGPSPVDSPTGRAHQHAAGARTDPPLRPRQLRTAPSSGRCRQRPAFRGSVRDGLARGPRTSRPTRGTATARAARGCGVGASGTRSRGKPTAGPPAYAKAHAADGHSASMRTVTGIARGTGEQPTQAVPSGGHAVRQVGTPSLAPSPQRRS